MATFNASSALAVILKVDWERWDSAFGAGSPNTTWHGAAACVNYAFSDRWHVSLRGEYLTDSQGFITAASSGQHLWESMVTVGYMPTKPLRAAARGTSRRLTDALLPPDTAGSAGSHPGGDRDGLSEVVLQGTVKF